MSNNAINIILLILLLVWATSFFAYRTGGFIHILLVLVVIGILVRLFRRRI